VPIEKGRTARNHRLVCNQSKLSIAAFGRRVKTRTGHPIPLVDSNSHTVVDAIAKLVAPACPSRGSNRDPCAAHNNLGRGAARNNDVLVVDRSNHELAAVHSSGDRGADHNNLGPGCVVRNNPGGE
jgi:hypothetical protein